MSTELCTIRNARHDDAPTLSMLSNQLGYPVPVEVMAERVFRLDPSNHAVFVAESDGNVIGYVDVGIFFHLQSGFRGEVGGLVVAESARSRGIGRQLLERAEQWARSKGAIEVQLRSNMKRVEAHRFYLRENYTLIKTSGVFQKKL